jgi:P-type E1-E2 ATPase
MIVLLLLIILLVLIALSTIFAFTLQSEEFDSEPISTMIMFALLYNHIIPISLIFGMDLVRILQSVMIQNDSNMNKGVVVNTSDVNEDLGQIEYIVADKVGTITTDTHSLKSMFVDGKLFLARHALPSEEKLEATARPTEVDTTYTAPKT